MRRVEKIIDEAIVNEFIRNEELVAKAIAHLLDGDKKMGQLIEEQGKLILPPPKGGDYFGIICHSIVSQQLATKSANAIYGRFSSYYGDKPEASKVLATPVEQLRQVGLSGQKVNYLRDLSTKVEEGELVLEDLPELANQEIIDQLVKVKGIGVWTAEIFLIFALGRSDILPVADLGIKKGVQQLYHLEELPDKKQLLELAKPWHPYATVASLYLWQSLNNS